MNLDDMPRKAGDPRYISGVYNYCDGWCERCAFTERCRNFAMRIEFEEMAENRREERESDEALAELLDPLDDFDDLDDLPVESPAVDDFPEPEDWEIVAYMAEEERIRARIKAHPLTQAAEAYIGMASDWFDFGHGQDRRAGGRAPLIEPQPGSDEIESESEQVKDAVEVIRWYQLFIAVKIQRALHSLESEAREPEFWEDMPRDSEGTAKIALIAIDRSTGAWATLMEAFPARRTETLPILALLTRLRYDLEVEFPNAWVFVRPGFDEGEEGDEDDGD